MAEIKIDSASLDCSAAGVVHGKLSLSVDGTSFPDASWSDAVVVVLTAWCHALSKLTCGDPGPIEVRFMDGPYLVELTSVAPERDDLHLNLIKAGLRRQILGTASVQVGSLVGSTLSAADQILVECRRRGWRSRDTDDLGQAANELRRCAKTNLLN